MAAARKKVLDVGSFERSQPSIRLANAADQGGACAVHEQQILLESAFSEVRSKPYPAPVRLAVLIGAPVALWAGVIWTAAQIGRMV